MERRLVGQVGLVVAVSAVRFGSRERRKSPHYLAPEGHQLVDLHSGNRHRDRYERLNFLEEEELE
jgi:hypothetical protein